MTSSALESILAEEWAWASFILDSTKPFGTYSGGLGALALHSPTQAVASEFQESHKQKTVFRDSFPFYPCFQSYLEVLSWRGWGVFVAVVSRVTVACV